MEEGREDGAGIAGREEREGGEKREENLRRVYPPLPLPVVPA